MVERAFPAKLIPPGIHDARAAALLGAFAAMASEFDFSDLLMRTGDEIPIDALGHAIHDFSLTEFIGPDGLPAYLVRKLVDDAWELHEQQGTDAGVKLGQSLLGIGVDIEHWWQKDPVGHHDTQIVTLYLGDTDNPPIEPLSLEVQQTSHKMIEATKRYSQDTDLVWRTRARMDLYIHAVAQDLQKTRIMPGFVTELNSSMALASGATANVGEVMRIRPIPITQGKVNSPLSFGASASSGEFLRIYPYQPTAVSNSASYDVAIGILPASSIITILPEGAA